MSAPASTSISSVWVRVVTASRTTVVPLADSPASRMADFTWALATREVQSMPCSRPPSRRSGGRQRAPRPRTVAPMRPSGSATLSMGRAERDSSPTSSVSHANPATSPASRRIDVPEFPHSSGPSARCSRPRPPWRTTVPSSWRSTPAPIAATAASEAATSAPSESPRTLDVPSARAPRRTARCEIDFSPGVRTDPRQGTPPVTTRTRGGVTTGARPGSGSRATRPPRTASRRRRGRRPGSARPACPPPSARFRCRRCRCRRPLPET